SCGGFRLISTRRASWGGIRVSRGFARRKGRRSGYVHDFRGNRLAKGRHNPQTISWFWDLFQRKLLNLAPPYQRRSVWNMAYREYFIDTILLEYPAPAIFLFSEVEPSGRTMNSVVDGKQRLITIFGFVQDEFPVGEKAEITALRGKYFS